MNSGDGIDYHQRFSENIGDLIQVRVTGVASGAPPYNHVGTGYQAQPISLKVGKTARKDYTAAW